MNTFRTLIVASIVSLAAACSSAPSKPAAPPPPPAINVSGNWVITIESPMGSQDSKLLVKQAGKDLSGTMESPMGSVDYIGTLEGKEIKFGFMFNAQGADLRIDFVGTTDGSTMDGKAVFGTFGEGAFKGKKQ